MRCEGRVRNKAIGLFKLREVLSDGRWHSTAERRDTWTLKGGQRGSLR